MVIKKRKDGQEGAEKVPVPDVSINPEVIKNWTLLTVSGLIHIDRRENHKANCAYYAETGKNRKAVGGISRKDNEELKKAQSAKEKADLKVEMAEAKLHAKDRMDPVSVNLRLYDKLTVQNLKDLLKTRGLMNCHRENAKREAPLVLALNAADQKMHPKAAEEKQSGKVSGSGSSSGS